ncbi:YrhB domain-containing protein [Hymenobacter sp. B81]|uniref:YrhB domain-containing protein n=1 Tax=Hymenobacter sp. B81 TaxID=3344878 RepID=UPI0037DD94CB
MLTFEEARAIAQGKIDGLNANPNNDPDVVTDCVLVDEKTISKPYGWVFFYNSKCFLETEDISVAMAGNAPFIVNKYDGAVTVTGTAYQIGYYLTEYEKKKGYQS